MPRGREGKDGIGGCGLVCDARVADESEPFGRLFVPLVKHHFETGGCLHMPTQMLTLQVNNQEDELKQCFCTELLKT